MRRVRNIISALGCIGLWSCGPVTAPPGSEQVSEPAAINGMWASAGYGYLLDIDDEALRFFHVTPEFCMEADLEGAGLEEVFGITRPSASGQQLYLSSATEPYEFRFDRIDAIPERCETRPSSDPVTTVMMLSSLVQTHYGFLQERNIDWSTIETNLLEQIDENTTEEALYGYLTDALTEFHDAHVEMTAEVDGETRRFDADPGLLREHVQEIAARGGIPMREAGANFTTEFWVEGIGNTVLNGNGYSGANDRFRFGMLPDDIGYIAIRSMGGFASREGEPSLSEAEALAAMLDEALSHFESEQARAVVLDVSMNSGGYGYIARQIAARFMDRPIYPYSRFPWDAVDIDPFQQQITPHNGLRYDGPVVLLASEASVSAAESLVLAMRSLDHVIQVGEPTRGALSTKLAKPLPNGWEVMLSNEVILDHEGRLWEGRGIPPAIVFPVFVRGDLINSHQDAVERARVIAVQQAE